MGGRMRGRYAGIAKHAAEAARSGRIAADNAKPIKHGLSAYRSGKCRCREVCLPAHRERSAEVKRQKAEGTYVAPARKNAVTPEADAFALYLLQDGATYREAAKSAGIDQKQLAKRHPEYANNRREFDSVMASIKHKPKLLELHREIWQKGQTA